MLTIAAVLIIAATIYATRDARIVALVALALGLIVGTAYHEALGIDGRKDYTDPFGGTSTCLAVVDHGYNATWLFPGMDNQTYQVGTVCYHRDPTN